MSKWWYRWRQVVTRLITLAASISALLLLALPHVPTLDQLPWWGTGLAVVSVVMFVMFVWLEIAAVRDHRVFAVSDQTGIREYMHELIGHGGRVAIWTRDMSWAQNSETTELLRTKAKRRELIICLPESIPLTDNLRDLGGEIFSYGPGSNAPSSRFTITFFERDGSRVAVGRAQGDRHVIDEFDARESPAFYLAQDLIRLARTSGADS